jgi:DNA-binding NarL/FixJ family response regulator
MIVALRRSRSEMYLIRLAYPTAIMCCLFLRSRRPVDELPARECAVIFALENGDSHCVIADRLNVSEGRVSQISAALFASFGLRSA